MVSTLGEEYLNSYKNHDNTADDGPLYRNITLIQWGMETDMDSVEETRRAIEYRMSRMSTADEYLLMMEIAPPKGQLCGEYDTYRMIEEVGKVNYSKFFRLVLERKVLFPRPFESQGKPFYKGEQYLVAAFHHAQTLDEVVVEKLDALVATVDQVFEQETDVVKRDPEIASKRQKLFLAFGVALGNMSPSKRRSRGLSLTGPA